MVLLVAPSVSRHVICNNNWSLVLNLDLSYKELAEIGLLISVLENSTSLIWPVE